jgi:hypothetical protein
MHQASFLPARICRRERISSCSWWINTISIQTSVGDGVGLCVYRSVCEWGGVTSTVSLSMAALGYSYASVRFPLASRNVCPSNGMHLRPEANSTLVAKKVCLSGPLTSLALAGRPRAPPFDHEFTITHALFPKKCIRRDDRPVRIAAMSHLGPV